MIIVTGSKGYLGRYLCSNLDSKGLNYESYSHKELDLSDKYSVKKTIPEKSTIVHLAANLPKNNNDYKKDKFNQINLLMVENLLNTNPSKIIFSSSMTVYPYGGINLKEDEIGFQKELNGYPLYKREAEKMIESSGIKNTIFRFPGLFGGNRKSGIIYNCIYSSLTQKPFKLPDAPINWAALNVKDAADLISKAITYDSIGITNACTDNIFSTSILIGEVATILNTKIKFIIPKAPEFSMNLDKLRKTLGLPNKSFRQRLVEFIEEIKITLR